VDTISVAWYSKTMPAHLSIKSTPPAAYVPFSQWGAIAYDILTEADQSGLDDVCDTYGITRAQLDELQHNPRFIDVLTEVKNDLNKLGDNARFVSRARALTENMLPVMYECAISPKTETKDKIAIFKTFASLSGLDPATNGTKARSEDAPVQTSGNTFTLVIQNNIPGLEHLSGPVIEAPTKSNIIDVGDL
jgi:hypothetical protein